MLQTDIITHFKGEEKTIPDGCKFDVVYDAATGSGAGEDYKNKELSDSSSCKPNIDIDFVIGWSNPGLLSLRDLELNLTI